MKSPIDKNNKVDIVKLLNPEKELSERELAELRELVPKDILPQFRCPPATLHSIVFATRSGSWNTAQYRISVQYPAASHPAFSSRIMALN